VSPGAEGFHLHGVQVIRGTRPVLCVPELHLAAGQTTAVVGPSGAGKSTLLRLLAGLEPPTAGEIHSRGRGGKPLVPGEVVMVFQRPVLLRGTVAENVVVGLRLQRRGNREAGVRDWLERVGLGAKRHQPIRTLSGGEYQRVALARALVLEPAALLLDEPTAQLDPENVALIERVLREAQAERGMTVVWVTHNPFQAERVAHSVFLLLEGKVIEHSPKEIFFSPAADARTRDFLEGRLVW
jgi:tungstate transport system ATP-binding protein